MKKIKHTLILFISTFCLFATAQKDAISEEQKGKMEEQLAEYTSRLNLSETQQPKFEEITKRYGKQMFQLKDSGKGRLAKYNTFRAIRKDRNAEMKALLSKEQYQTYLKTQNEMQQKMMEKNKNKF